MHNTELSSWLMVDLQFVYSNGRVLFKVFHSGAIVNKKKLDFQSMVVQQNILTAHEGCSSEYFDFVWPTNIIYEIEEHARVLNSQFVPLGYM